MSKPAPIHSQLIAALDCCCGTVADKAHLLELAKQAKENHGRLLAALEQLACLGNEPHHGNSIGNRIAIDAIAAAKGGEA